MTKRLGVKGVATSVGFALRSPNSRGQTPQSGSQIDDQSGMSLRSGAVRDRRSARLGSGLQLHALPALWRSVVVLSGRGSGEAPEKPATDATSTYMWADREIAFHHCRTCGCLTHMEAVKAAPPVIFGVNARMMLGLDPARVGLRQIDNGHTGFFWTRSAESPIASRHPAMPPPGPDDWR
jgi:hypothetical protein